MHAELIALVLLAAFLHGLWGAAGKGSRDPVMAATVGALVPALAAAALVLGRGVTAPSAWAWPWMAAAVALHLLYIVSMLLAWRYLALVLAYPIARAGAAPVAAALGALFLDQPLSLAALAGLGALALGLLVLGAGRAVLEGRGAAGAALAVLSAACLGGATAADYVGLHRADSTLGYIVWIALAEGAVVVPAALIVRRRGLAALPWRELPVHAATALCAAASYAMVLWALSLAPLAPVAALRETQALFAAVIGAAFLGQRLGPRGLAAAGLVAAGAIAVNF
jgi:drug/metabolite transporter (DMT)-like permease